MIKWQQKKGQQKIKGPGLSEKTRERHCAGPSFFRISPLCLSNQAAQSLAQTCLQALASPQTCPFVGSCHICPLTIQAKQTISQRAKELQEQISLTASIPEMPPIFHEILRLPGQLLDLDTCTLMEFHFSHDFSRMKVYADERVPEQTGLVEIIIFLSPLCPLS